MDTENKMGVMPVRKLILHMSWPMMLSMLIQALYNMVDSIFVAQISEEAFLALSLVYPVQMLMVAVCVGTGVGVNAVLSRRLGEGDRKKAGAVALNGFLLYFLTWVAFVVLSLTVGRGFMGLFTDDPVVARFGLDYMTIVTVFSLGMCMQFAAERVMQATGNPKGPMIVQGIGAVVNLILDPIFIFDHVGPIPGLNLGVAGAAIATVLGQFVGMGFGFFLVRRVREIELHFRQLRPDREAIADIYRIGVPAIIMQSLSTIMTMGLNKILGLFSAMDVVILGAYFKLQSFIFMPVYGLNNGLVPVVSYNYGARSRSRIQESVRFSCLLGVAIMAVGTLLLLLIPGPLMGFFTDRTDTIAAGVTALRIVSLSFPFAGLGIVFSSIFQALSQPRLSLAISLLRQLILVLPVAFLLGLVNHNLVWWTFLLAEVLSAALCLLFYRRVQRIQLAALPD